MDPELTRPIKELKEKWALLPSFLQARGLVKQHIESFDYFLSHELRSIMEANKEIRCEADPKWFFRYKRIYLGAPSVNDRTDLAEMEITPHECRLRDLSYSACVYVDVAYLRGKDPVHCKRLPIGRIPIMLRSSRCVLRGKSERELEALKECPFDPGGYFIVKGTEKVILIQEQLSKNRIIIESDPKDNLCASVTSSTHERKSKTNIVTKHGKLLLKHNAFT